MANTVKVSGMFGSEHTYFSGSPVVIDISGLEWPSSSPFDIVKVNIKDSEDNIIGDFHADTGGQAEISFDIQSALRALWADYDFTDEVTKAEAAIKATSVDGQSYTRDYRSYSIELYTEYLDSNDNEMNTSQCDLSSNEDGSSGKCMIGALTEWERYNVSAKEEADASSWEHTGLRNGDASTKPTSSPERVGQNSITSWVDVNNDGTTSVFFHPKAQAAADSETEHSPLVLRDSQDYQDFIFVNRRGAVETCSALTKESMDISIDVDSYNRIERPSFIPSRSLFSVATGGRRSWEMSSGYTDRAWAEWWVQEFLMAQRHWMRIDDKFVPVIVEPSKKNIGIYDKAKQDMPHVDFTVTLALEG